MWIALHGPSSAFRAQIECPSFRGGKGAPVIKRSRTTVIKLLCFTEQLNFKVKLLACCAGETLLISVCKALNTLNIDVKRQPSSPLEHKFISIKWKCWFQLSTKRARIPNTRSSS